MVTKKSVSVIIPNYNGEHLLKEYLPFTIIAVTNAEVPYEIIVVDDCSTDNSVQFLELQYPDIKIIQNSQNRGFSYSCNRGIAVAKCELILLLNSDVKLNFDYFQPLWPYFIEEDTFGVMGHIMDMEGSGLQDAARMPAFNGFKIKTAYFYYSRNTTDRLLTFYLSGANALINTAKLKAIGGFNEIFSPFYGEDLELGIRAWRLNWRCYYEHQAVCKHQVSASTKKYKTANWIKSIYYRNRFYVHAIHLDGIFLIFWYLQITLIDLLPRLLSGQLWIWSSYKQLFSSYRMIQNARKDVKQQMLQHASTTSVAVVIRRIQQSICKSSLVRYKA